MLKLRLWYDLHLISIYVTTDNVMLQIVKRKSHVQLKKKKMFNLRKEVIIKVSQAVTIVNDLAI